MLKILTLFLLLTISLSVSAQDFNYGGVTTNEYNFNRNSIDSNANAVVLSEFGTAYFLLNEARSRLEIVFEYHVRIKIINKDGFKQANIVIPTYKDDSRDTYETLSDIQGMTINLKNGILTETALDKKSVFKENRSKYTMLTKFTMPDVQEGSIIEYKYRLESPLIHNFKTWEFQADIPKVSSKYLVYIPGNYNYNVTLRGYQKITETKSEISTGCFRLSGKDIDCSKITYIMEKIPAFVEESFMTAASNFKSAIYFELSDVHYLDGTVKSYTKTWRDIDIDLQDDRLVGSQMKRKDLFKDLVPVITKDDTDELAKAKSIYNYIRKQIKWNNIYGYMSENTVKTALDQRSGNVADINYALISALSAANLNAEAVILSTRENGNVNKLFPITSDFNYVVAKVNIGEKSYFLDATEPLLPFGLLPLRCINDQGRVINLKKPSYWVDLKASVKSVTNYLLTGQLNLDGKIVGKISTTTVGYDAYNKRREIKKYNSIDEYVEKLDERLSNISISKQEILNLDSVENPLIEVYEVEFAAHTGITKDQLYISPFMINPINKNPFKLNDRNYPVDLGAASDERISINLTLPASYELLEQPKNLAIALPENKGRYLVQTKLENDILLVTQLLQFNQAIYDPEYYLTLKEFYSKIIQNQKTDVLLKKVN